VTDEDNLKEARQWRAFRPKPADKDLSIARIEGLTTAEIWLLGDELASRPSHRTVYGRADFDQARVRTVVVKSGARLDVVAQEPPPRHAIIIGWPDDQNERKTICIQLAAEAVWHSV
jgi:hypothetical protein